MWLKLTALGQQTPEAVNAFQPSIVFSGCNRMLEDEIRLGGLNTRTDTRAKWSHYVLQTFHNSIGDITQQVALGWGFQWIMLRPWADGLERQSSAILETNNTWGGREGTEDDQEIWWLINPGRQFSVPCKADHHTLDKVSSAFSGDGNSCDAVNLCTTLFATSNELF